MNSLKKYIIFTLLFAYSFAFSQKTAYQIKVNITNYSDSVLYLVNYYGNTNQLKDTAYLSKSKNFVFNGKDLLPGGIYLVVTSEKRYFELLIDKEQNFEVNVENNNFLKTIKFTGTNDNVNFYKYLNQITVFGEKRTKLEDEYKIIKDSLPSRKKEIEAEFEKINEELVSYKMDVAKNNPNTFLATIINASKEPEIPKVLPKNEKGEPDSTYIYTFFKTHFFDDFDFADERILRTPIYAAKLKKYFTQVIVQRPDSLIKEADEIIASSKRNKETYKFCIWYFTYESETSNIMGIDAVFVHLVKKYYLAGEAYWVTDGVLNNLKKRSETLERLLIGKLSPNLIMWDTNSRLVGLHELKANYTIVLFWDPDCGHCKAEIPKIKNFYDENKKKYGLEVFSVCSDTNLVVWRKYLVDAQMHFINVNGTRSATEDYHDLYDVISTPVIYLLDKNKRIIAKKLSYEQMVDFIKRDFEKTEN